MRWSTRLAVALVLATVAAYGAEPIDAQEIRGRVLDERTEVPVGTALVRLVDEEGESRSVTLADSVGVYRLRVPGPGTFRLEAERFGYSDLETPLLRAVNPEAVYPLDLLMTPAPVELQGFTVEADRVSDERVDQNIRHMVGLTPPSLRYEPIRLGDIQSHIDARRMLEDLIRFEAKAGLLVRRTTEGTCYDMRGRCVPVHLNGVRMNEMFVGGIPLDMLYTIVVVTPGDGSVVYPGGAVLLYTEGWVR